MARSAGVVGGATLASRVLGMLRDGVLFNLFAPGILDTFVIAFMIPNLFRRLVGEGTLTVAFVPIFTGWLRRSREEACRVFNATWTLGALAALAICVAGIAFAEPLASVFAPGFRLEPGKLELCALLLRWCFPYILLLTLVAVAMGALNSMGHFFAPAIAPVLLNLCLIGGACVGILWVEPPILALGAAVILAGLLQVLLQLPPLLRRGLSPRPLLAPGHPAIRRLGALMAPAVLGASVYQLNILVVRLLASFQGDGAVAYLYFADRLIEFPLGVFIFALGTASLPSFARLVKQGDAPGLRGAFGGTLGLAVALALPSTVGLALLREPIFSALFAWNTRIFGPDAIEGCGRALLCYALGLVPISVSRIYVQLCIAHENTRTPARAAVVSLVVNILACLALIGPLPEEAVPAALRALHRPLQLAELGYAGLALATSIAAAANCLYLALATGRRYGKLLGLAELGRLAKLLGACAGMGLGVWASSTLLPVPPESSVGALALLALHVGFGLAVYAGLLALARSPELGTLLQVARRRRGSASTETGGSVDDPSL